MKKKILISIYCLLVSFAFSQNLTKYGKFNGHFFSQKDLKSGTQIWSGQQDKFGTIFIGNNNKVLSYNGVSWKIIECDSAYSGLENFTRVHNSKVNKIFASESGKIYVGRKNNFGEIRYTKSGKPVYHPLFASKTEQELGQVWNIFEVRKSIYFVGESKVFQLKNNEIKEISIPKVSNYLCKTAGKLNDGILLVYSATEELSDTKKYVFLDCKTKETKEVILPETIDYLSITGTIELNSTIYIFNVPGTVYKVKLNNKSITWSKEQVFSVLKDYQINCVKFKNGLFYVGTEEEGVLVLNAKGKIVRKFGLKDGMENLVVYDLFHDKENNLWLCLDNGVQFFETSSPITFYDKLDGLIETINFLNITGKTRMVASKSDIWIPYEENYHQKFKTTNSVKQEVYDLQTFKTNFGEKTVAIGFNGIYEIGKDSSELICEKYAWTMIQNPLNVNEIFIGLENSFGKISLDKNGWKFQTIIPNLNGEIIDFGSLNGKIIFGVKKNGVFIYDIKSNKYSKIKSDLATPYVVEKFQNTIYIGMQTGLYTLSQDFKKLIPFKEINFHFNGNNDFSIHRIFNQNDKKLWIIILRENTDKLFEHGWLEKSNDKWKWTSWPFEQFNIKENALAFDIKQIDENNTWFANGSFISNYNEKALNAINRRFTVSIDEIFINNQIKIYDPFKAESLGDLEYKDNTLKFVFHANSFMGINQMKYRFKLDNYTEEWSEWSDLNFTDFKKISEGTYKLKIQAKNIYGFNSEILEYEFTILPPWYRTWWAFTLYFITFIFLIYFTIQLSIKRVKNQNIKLEETVKERTSEIATQNQQLEIQKEEIEQKTKDIVDSIVYAKRIQETILPTKERLNSFFDQHFVFYRPKDIVSGDFYWARKKGNLAIFSALDCTGHGVPGALVSIVGNAALLRCVNEHKLTEPAEILDKLRDIVVRSFDATGQSDVKDGMDMSLCTLDFDTLKLKFSGANNECFIIRDKELIELRPDKQPIGKFSHATPFTQKEIQLQKGDCVYQYTDGFVDQFGGERGKKLKSRPFKEYINIISHLSMEEQHEKIRGFFDSWIENYEQVDDVCVFGIKV